MAFGKKKDDAAPGIVAQLETDVFEAGPAEAEAPQADQTDVPGDGAPAEAPEAAAAVPAAEAPPSGEPDLGGDALLNMFQTTSMELEDRSAVLELAGDVELDDLLEELQTVAVALGVGR
jgi:hypothetical protein